MPKGQLYINGYDAYTRWGMSMDSSALSALMTPSANKENLHTSSRTANGQKVSRSVMRVAPRQLTVIFQICAKTEAQFFAYYESFCKELAKGYLYVETEFQPNVCYRFEYNGCNQFSQFMRGIGKFTLKLTENDPTDRALPKVSVLSYALKLESDELEYDFSRTGSYINISGDEADVIQEYGLDATFSISAMYGDIPIEVDSVGVTFKNKLPPLNVVNLGNGRYYSYADDEITSGMNRFDYIVYIRGVKYTYWFALRKVN